MTHENILITVGSIYLQSLEDREKALTQCLKSLLTNPHMNLEDATYLVRDAEGEGWEGPAVKAWSDAVMQAKKLVGEIS